MKNTITEMKNALHGINSRLENAEEWISNLEEREVEITKLNSKEKRKKWGSLKGLWNNIKYTNILITGFLEGEERGKRAQNLFQEIMA